MSPHSLQIVGMLCANSSWVLQIPLVFWAVAAMPGKDNIKKYSRRIIWQSMVPFAYKWRQVASSDDLPRLERFRRRWLIYLLSVVVSANLLTFGLLLDEWADLQMQTSWRMQIQQNQVLMQQLRTQNGTRNAAPGLHGAGHEGAMGKAQ